METPLNGPEHAPLSCGKAVYLVVLLHGNGSDGNGMIDIGIDWGAPLNKAKFLAPHAPFSDSAEKQWLDRQGDARPAAALLNAYLDEVLASHRLDESHLALVGFDDGAKLALQVGLNRQVGAVVAVSGGSMPDAIGAKPPVLLAHDAASEQQAKAFQAALATNGIAASLLCKPGDYFGLDEEGIDLVAAFLRKSLADR